MDRPFFDLHTMDNGLYHGKETDMAKVGIEDDCKDMVIHNTEDEYNCAHINAEMENGGKVFGNQAEFDFCYVA